MERFLKQSDTSDPGPQRPIQNNQDHLQVPLSTGRTQCERGAASPPVSVNPRLSGAGSKLKARFYSTRRSCRDQSFTAPFQMKSGPTPGASHRSLPLTAKRRQGGPTKPEAATSPTKSNPPDRVPVHLHSTASSFSMTQTEPCTDAPTGGPEAELRGLVVPGERSQPLKRMSGGLSSLHTSQGSILLRARSRRSHR